MKHLAESRVSFFMGAQMNAYLMSKDAKSQANFYIDSLGGESKYPFALQPWGAYYGEVIDLFGVTWMITKK